MKNRFLKSRHSRMMDGRNPYGSRGGYLSSRKMRDRMSSRGMSKPMDYEYDMPEHSGRYDSRMYPHNRMADYNYGGERHREYSRPMQYEMYGIGGMRPRMEYDYGYDYGHEHEKDMEKEYEHDLHEWAEKLKKHDRFGWSKEQVINQARNMGVKFEEYDEMEFYVTYLMQMSDYKQVANEPHTYLAMAKAFLEDDDVELKGSDKLCAYLYTIVLDEEE